MANYSASPALSGRIAVAMSGGLDSSMALVLLREAGHEVLGVTMRLWPPHDTAADTDSSDIGSARQVCAMLGVEHVVLDLRDRFYAEVVVPFVSEYASARTPNPCTRCNEAIKFGALLDSVRALGCDTLSTGHYARSAFGGTRYRLLRGIDPGKDQSYFLYTLSQQQLAHLLFPLGGFHKDQVRAMAAQRGLAVTERPESQDVCFLRGEPYSALLARCAPDALRPGPILNREGAVLGTHQGLPLYTVGQRSGLGIAADRPLYVLELDGQRNALVVGYSEDLDRRALLADCMHYVAGSAPAEGERLQAQIRYRARPVDASLEPFGDRQARVSLSRPVRGIAPGQAVVLYDGDEVIGGGRITRVEPADEAQEQ
jgi:tRNA-specific 2-thiouridylase